MYIIYCQVAVRAVDPPTSRTAGFSAPSSTPFRSRCPYEPWPC